MNADILNLLRDPAGVPFYPVVFQGLYILTWALHALFVFLSLGSLGLSLYGTYKQKSDETWKFLTPHLLQTGKVSVSLLIVLGVAPLLFTQVIYDPNWYTINTLSGLWVVIFIYTLLIGYSMYYLYYYANKKGATSTKLIGIISFLLLLFAGLLMHIFSVQAIQPEKWLEWYAPNGIIDTSGLTFNPETFRYLFFISLSIPAVGLFLQNYSDFLENTKNSNKEFLIKIKNFGTKLASSGLLLSLILFLIWSFEIGKTTDIFSSLIILFGFLLIFATIKLKNSYLTSILFLVFLLVISGFREYLRFNIMNNLGYNIYEYPVNIEWSSISMFILTFISLGAVGVTFIATIAWKVGKNDGYFDASKDKVVTLLANSVLWILSSWCIVYFAWGFYILFKNSL